METYRLDDIEILREAYKPPKGQLKVVFLGESRPDPGEGQPRMFYIPHLSSHDNLFRGLMRALYDAGSADLKGNKSYWMERFKTDGFWLLDVVPYPVNRLPPKERKAAILSSVDFTLSRIKREPPSHGIIVCHAATYRVIKPRLDLSRIKVLHDTPIPFPLAADTPRFIKTVRESLRNSGISVPFPKQKPDYKS